VKDKKQRSLNIMTQPLYKRVFFSIYSYAFIYALFGVLSLTYHACFNSSLSTLEKRYRFSSTTGGYIMITDNVATVLTNLFIGYYGKTAHKPRWMSIGCMVTGLSVMVTALPYFIYGPAHEKDLDIVANKTLSKVRAGDQMCLTNEHIEDCSQNDANSVMTMVAVACFGISNFFRGFGTSIYFTYGTPYLDDNVSKAKMPTFFAFIFAARLFGAPIGFYMSSLALKIYENPFSVPAGLTNSDPRWIGAWWIGFLFSGSMMLLLAIPLSLFPREFKKKPKRENNEGDALELVDQPATKGENQQTCCDQERGYTTKGGKVSQEETSTEANQDLSLSKLPGELYDIFTNPMIICQMMGNMFRGIGIIGYYVFQTKYLESQFRQSASKASLVSGTTGFLGKIVGLLAGGLLITMCRPGPRTLTTYIFIVEVTTVFALLYGGSVMGPQYAYPRADFNEDGQLDLTNNCNSACHCEHVRYQPVCEHSEMKAYFSPCHAGCTMSFATADNSSSEYTNCACADSPILQKCPPDTDRLLKYATIIAMGSMVSGSSKSGNMVTFFRSINPDQKSLAVAVGGFWHSLFVSIPYPIIYGKIFDYSCLVWSRECGTRGNCWLYDTEKLRYIYHGVSIALIALGSVFDLIMIFLSPRLGNLYDDNGKKSLRDRIVGMVTKRKRNDQTVGPEPSPPPKQASSIPCI
jgi:organic anion transporter 5A